MHAVEQLNKEERGGGEVIVPVKGGERLTAPCPLNHLCNLIEPFACQRRDSRVWIGIPCPRSPGAETHEE